MSSLHHAAPRVRSASILVLSIAAGALPSVGRATHPVRAPFVLEPNGIVADRHAIGSDGELTVCAYVEATDPNRVLARTSDGRGLSGTWSVGVVSDQVAGERVIQADSVQVVSGRAAIVWLDDAAGTNRSRLFVGRFDGSTHSLPLAVNETGLAGSFDIERFAVSMRLGPNGKPYLAIVFAGRDVISLAVGLYGVVSADGGVTFGAPFPISSAGVVPGATAKQIGGVAVDTKGGELHVAWTDDRNDPAARREVFYRRALLDWSGAPIFFPPLGSGADVRISATDDVLGAPVIAVDDDPFAATGFDKHVGVLWRELDKGAGTPTLRVRTSRDSGSNFLLESVVAHTGIAGVAVDSCDLEVCGGSFVATFHDNARDVGGGSVVVLPIGLTHVWRVIASDAADFSAGAEVAMLSASAEPNATGKRPVVSRVRGTVDAAVIAFLEDGFAGTEVRTSFADQAYGAAWHLDDLPRVSAAQSGLVAREVHEARAAYNARYSNFLVTWAQEFAPDTGVFQLWIGGYRPQTVEISGWSAGSPALSFAVRHLPWQDSFAFVLLSAQAAPNPPAQFLLPDGRRTGLATDLFLQLGLSNWIFFAAQNDPIAEGAFTTPIPLPPGVVTPGFPLSCVGVSWGPGGALHVVTDFVTATG